MPHSARYKLNLLLPHINANARSFPLIFEAVLSAANKALTQDNVSKEDLEQAVAMAQEVKTARSPAVFELQLASLRNRIGDAAYPFMEVTASGFKWPETLAAIDSAVENRELTAAEGAAAKEKIRLFSLIYEHGTLAGEVSVSLATNEPTAPNVTTMATTVEHRISVSFQYLMKPITTAATKVAMAVKVNPTFSEIPSWTRLVSAVMRVVISPAPSSSKKAIFCLRMAAKNCCLILVVMC
jgi:hypothetical protein